MHKLHYEALCAVIVLLLMALASLGAWCLFSNFDREVGRTFPGEATVTRVMQHKAVIETKYGDTYTCKLLDDQPFEKGEAVRVYIIEGRMSHKYYCGGIAHLK